MGERARLRLAVACNVASVAVFLGYGMVLLAGDLGWVDYAALTGSSPHAVWVFLSEGLGTAVFFVCANGFGLACGLGLPPANRRPSYRPWVIGPPLAVLGLIGCSMVALVVSILLCGH